MLCLGRDKEAAGRGTDPADEALGVPEGVEGGDVVLQDGAGAAAALGRKHVKVVLPAVRLAVLLVEAFGTHTHTHGLAGLNVWREGCGESMR